MIHKKSCLLAIWVLFSINFCQAQVINPYNHPLYAGIIAGYGSTTWSGLVATKKNQNDALMLSTPVDVEEGGATVGALLGYEFSPNFALEANYIHYPKSIVYFNPMSLYSFTHDGSKRLITNSESFNLMAKIMLAIPKSNFRIFSSAGLASLYRKDIIINNWRLTPTFGAGLNYNFTKRIMGEIAANYTAGFGESQLSPVDTYYPFLYSVSARIAYRI